MIKIGIVGSRRRNTAEDYELVKNRLDMVIQEQGNEVVVLVSGGCPQGADNFVKSLTDYFNLLEPIIYFADWKRKGRSAGFQRNTYIARDSDILIAVVAEDRTGGTEDTIKKFQKLHPTSELILL